MLRTLDGRRRELSIRAKAELTTDLPTAVDVRDLAVEVFCSSISHAGAQLVRSWRRRRPSRQATSSPGFRARETLKAVGL